MPSKFPVPMVQDPFVTCMTAAFPMRVSASMMKSDTAGKKTNSVSSTSKGNLIFTL
jgi:hypothetical protein